MPELQWWSLRLIGQRNVAWQWKRECKNGVLCKMIQTIELFYEVFTENGRIRSSNLALFISILQVPCSCKDAEEEEEENADRWNSEHKQYEQKDDIIMHVDVKGYYCWPRKDRTEKEWDSPVELAFTTTTWVWGQSGGGGRLIGTRLPSVGLRPHT